MRFFQKETEREVVTNSISFHGMRLTIPLYIIPFRRQCLKVHRIMILYPRNFLINHLENSRRKRFCIRALNIRRKTLLSKFAAVAYSEENATNASNYKTPRAFLNRSVRIVARHWLRAALCYLSLFLRSSSDGMSGGE